MVRSAFEKTWDHIKRVLNAFKSVALTFKSIAFTFKVSAADLKCIQRSLNVTTPSLKGHNAVSKEGGEGELGR